MNDILKNQPNRIDQTFAALKLADKIAFVAFITAGDVKADNPIKETVAIMHGLVDGGTDVIELGVPFSDPSADGLAIQKANERALLRDIGLDEVLAMVLLFREIDQKTPVILMGYLNPIENFGYENFTNQSKQAGVDGLITVDLPPEESAELDGFLHKANIHPIYLIAPTSTTARIKMISKHAKGFVYYVSVKGITGQKSPDFKVVSSKIKIIKQFTNLPVAVGFGIKNNSDVQIASESADAVVVGSAIVNKIQQSTNAKESVRDFVRQLKFTGS